MFKSPILCFAVCFRKWKYPLENLHKNPKTQRKKNKE